MSLSEHTDDLLNCKDNKIITYMTYAAAHWFRHSNYIAVGKLKATMKIYIDMINKYQICKWVLVLHKQPPTLVQLLPPLPLHAPRGSSRPFAGFHSAPRRWPALWLARLGEVYALGRRIRRFGFRRFLIGWFVRRGVVAEL